MTVDLFTIIFLLGAIQGLILSLYLFFSRNDKRQAKYFLGFLILILAYDVFETAWAVQRIRLITTAIFTYSHLLTLGASVYLFVRTSIKPEKIPARTILLFYLPAIGDFAISLIIFLLSFERNLPDKAYFSIYETHLISSRLLMVAVFWIYFGFAVKEFRLLDQNTPNAELHNSKSEIGIVKKWLRSFLFVCFVIAIVWTMTVFGVILFDRQQVLYFYYPLEILLAFLIYWIGFTSYHQIKIVYLNEQKNSRIYFNKLSADEISEAAELLSKAMSIDKVYLDSELTLAGLAEHLRLPPKMISAVLNQHLKTNFNEYVNEFRVEEFKIRILKPENAHLTIIAVALDSGFNSLATFQRVFKNMTGLTPKQFSSSISP